jgi:hypothetical protein
MIATLNFINLAFGLGALALFCLSIYWLFNKIAKKRQIAKLREMLDKMDPTDPEYNQAKTLYATLMLDAHHWDANSGGHDDTGSNYSGEGGSSDGD